MILYSDYILQGAATDNSPSNAIARNRAARVKLDRAEEALRQARDILVSERRNVWWWTLMYLIEARLRHDKIALTTVSLVGNDGRDFSDDIEERKRKCRK